MYVCIFSCFTLCCFGVINDIYIYSWWHLVGLLVPSLVLLPSDVTPRPLPRVSKCQPLSVYNRPQPSRSVGLCYSDF